MVAQKLQSIILSPGLILTILGINNVGLGGGYYENNIPSTGYIDHPS